MEKLARLVLNAYKWRENLVSITETRDHEFSSIRVYRSLVCYGDRGYHVCRNEQLPDLCTEDGHQDGFFGYSLLC